MISDSNLVCQEQPLFSRPEILEQLRDQLLSLVRQDSHNLQELLQEMHQDMVQVVDRSETASQGLPECTLRLAGYLSEFEEQARERSSNIATLSHLAVKMIDYIRDEQLRHCHVAERYEAEVDALRNTVQFLSSKNHGIENDVEIFREQLMAAQEELEGIVGEEGQEGEGIVGEGEKDRQIEVLQCELQKIKEQLRFYKFNARSRRSRLQLERQSLTANRSEDFLWCVELEKQERQVLQQELSRSMQVIDHLERENQMLRRDIVVMSESRIREQGRHCSRQIREEVGEETEREMVRNRTIQQLVNREEERSRPILYKATSFTHLQKIPSTPQIVDKEGEMAQMELQNEQFEVLSQLQQQPSTPLMQSHKCHPLSSEWSTKSFQMHLNNLVYENLKPTKLIFLNQEDQEMTEKGFRMSSFNYSNSSNNNGVYNPTVIQQTRETENSIKGSDSNHLKFKKLKDYCDVGINTVSDLQQPVEKQKGEKGQGQIKVQEGKGKGNGECGGLCGWESSLSNILSNPIMGALSSFIVRRRVRRSSEKTRQTINAIVC